MTLADVIHAHIWWPGTGCSCGAPKPKGDYRHADHLQDAILAAFPALADLLPEVDCSICGDWRDREHMTPTIPDGWVCNTCQDEMPKGWS